MDERGSDEQLARLMEAWGQSIMRFAYVYTGDVWTAQDVAQETFLRLYRHLLDKGQAPHAHWLFTVARNVAADVLRRQRRHTAAMSALARSGSESAVEEPGDRVRVRQVLDSLADVDRTCLVLFYFGGWSVKAISRELSLTPAGVKSRLHRARARFAQRWADGEREMPDEQRTR